MLFAALFTIAKIWKHLRVHWWMDKENVVCIDTEGILLSHKKDEILPSVTTWMDREGIILSECLAEKDK